MSKLSILNDRLEKIINEIIARGKATEGMKLVA